MRTSLTRLAFQGLKWSVLARLAGGLGTPVLFLVLARLLRPEDFGVVAAATTVISFSYVFSGAGLKPAFIQRPGEYGESANATFWLPLILGTLIALLLILFAPLAAHFFHDERITSVVRVLSVLVPLRAFSSVQIAILEKELNFQPLFWTHLVESLAPFLVAAVFAFAGFDYWALVIGNLAAQVIQCLMLWGRSGWRPRLGLRRDVASELLAFGKWAMASAILGWFFLWIDAVVVARYLGTGDLGLYRTAHTLVVMITGLLFSPILPVLYSLLSRAHFDVVRLRSALETIAHSITLVTIPFGLLVFVSREELGRAFFDEPWSEIGPVVGYLALTHAISWVVGANGEVYRAMGRPNVETWSMALAAPVYLAGYLISVQYGLDTFLMVRLGLAIFGAVVHVAIARRILGMPVSTWVFPRVLAPSVTAAGVISWINLDVEAPMAVLSIHIVIFLVLVMPATLILDRRFVRQMIGVLRSSYRTE